MKTVENMLWCLVVLWIGFFLSMVVNLAMTEITVNQQSKTPWDYQKRSVYIYPNRYTAVIVIYTNQYNVPVILTSSKPLKEVAISEVTNVPPISIVWQTNSATNIVMTIRLIPNPETDHPAKVSK